MKAPEKIPKIIHYCWFGNKKIPKKYKKNIQSWKRIMPDYEIWEWNEKNFNIHENPFIEYAYNNKKWAFVSDYARLKVIYENGGIYLDTDVEVIKSFDELLSNKAFMGIEHGGYINTGLGFGAIPKHPSIKENLDAYASIKETTPKLTSCPIITTNILNGGKKLSENSKYVLKDITIYPVEFFCPMNYITGQTKITKNTFSIHKYTMSWGDKTTTWENTVQRFLLRFLGVKKSKIISKFIFAPSKILKMIRAKGLRNTLVHIIRKKGTKI